MGSVGTPDWSDMPEDDEAEPLDAEVVDGYDPTEDPEVDA